MIRYLDFEVVKKLNYSPFKGVLPPYYIPWVIVYQQPWEYNKKITIPFGSFVQSKNDNNPTNSNVLQKIDGICIGSLDKNTRWK